MIDYNKLRLEIDPIKWNDFLLKFDYYRTNRGWQAFTSYLSDAIKDMKEVGKCEVKDFEIGLLSLCNEDEPPSEEEYEEIDNPPEEEDNFEDVPPEE